MSAYKIVNLMELDDTVGDRVPGLEGRFARKQLESRDLGVSHWRYEPDFRAPSSHRHGEQEEAYVVVSGSGRTGWTARSSRCASGTSSASRPRCVRAFESGPDGLEFIAVGGPRPEEGDGEDRRGAVAGRELDVWLFAGA